VSGAVEGDYYQSIEEFFVSRRGDPLLLSTADWTLIDRWRRQGIPLRIVLRGVADALDGHAHSWGRQRKVGSLRYCAASVAEARERWTRALCLGQDEGLEPAAALAALAAALETAMLGPDSARVAAAIARDLRSFQPGSDGVPALEPWLASREKELVAALASEAGEASARQVESEVGRTLASYRDRMPERVFARLVEEGLARRWLSSRGLPRLSLALL